MPEEHLYVKVYHDIRDSTFGIVIWIRAGRSRNRGSISNRKRLNGFTSSSCSLFVGNISMGSCLWSTVVDAPLKCDLWLKSTAQCGSVRRCVSWWIFHTRHCHFLGRLRQTASRSRLINSKKVVYNLALWSILMAKNTFLVETRYTMYV